MKPETKTDWMSLLSGCKPLFEERSSIFNDVFEPGAERKTYQSCVARFETDYALAQQTLHFIFEDPLDVEDSTRDNVALLRRWHLENSDLAMPAICAFACDYLLSGGSDVLKKSVLTSAILGEIENTNEYHNNMHFKKVLIQILRMIATHNHIFDDTERALDQHQVALLMIAACIHDLGHDGKGNMKQGLFEPGRLEQQSFDLAKPYLIKAGLDEPRILESLEVMILSTDVSPLQDPRNPMNQMKAAYRFHYLGDNQKTLTLNLDEKLKLLESDRDLALMALILHEADIATSAGLSYPLTKYETIVLRQEIGMYDAKASHIIEFLNQVCQRQMISDAGQKLYAANMARIYALAEADVRRGDNALPAPEQSEFLRAYVQGAGDGSDQKTIN